MIPVVVRSTEEMLKLVPNELREASLALGVPKWRTILQVVLPTAIGGITTGVMLAIARIAGESAPIAAAGLRQQPDQQRPVQRTRSRRCRTTSTSSTATGTDAELRPRLGRRALVLIAFVMILNLAARAIARWKAPRHGLRLRRVAGRQRPSAEEK